MAPVYIPKGPTTSLPRAPRSRGARAPSVVRAHRTATRTYSCQVKPTGHGPDDTPELDRVAVAPEWCVPQEPTARRDQLARHGKRSQERPGFAGHVQRHKARRSRGRKKRGLSQPAHHLGLGLKERLVALDRARLAHGGSAREVTVRSTAANGPGVRARHATGARRSVRHR